MNELLRRGDWELLRRDENYSVEGIYSVERICERLTQLGIPLLRIYLSCTKPKIEAKRLYEDSPRKCPGRKTFDFLCLVWSPRWRLTQLKINVISRRGSHCWGMTHWWRKDFKCPVQSPGYEADCGESIIWDLERRLWLGVDSMNTWMIVIVYPKSLWFSHGVDKVTKTCLMLSRKPEGPCIL